MGLWKWEGLDRAGKRSTGKIQAATAREAKRLLRAQGNKVKKVTPPSILEFDIGEWMIEKGFAQPFSSKDLTNFTKQMAVMINAGVPIIQALEIMFKTEKNPVLKRCLQNIANDISEGKTLSESMSVQQGFDRLYCNLVKAGEVGGILDIILNKLAEHMDKQEKTKAQIKSAMTYPVLVSTIGTGIVWLLMTFVVPQFVGMLADSGKELPAITKLVIDISDFCGNYSIYFVPGFIFLALIFSSWKKTEVGKRIVDRIGMKMPGFGTVVIKGNLANFARTLGTLLSAGVSLIDALEICIETIDNSIIADDIRIVKQKVTEGKTLTEPLSKIDYFPEMVTQMIKVGEQTGGIDQMLEKISIVFEDDVNNAVTTATKMIEPIILVVLGGVVATILVAIYLPMFVSAG